MATRVATAQVAYDLDAQDKGQRVAWVAERRELLSRRRLERTATEKRTLELEVRGDVTTPKQEVARIRGAARVGARQSEAAVEIAKSKAAAVLRVTEAGRPWALMREQAARAGRAEVELETAIALIEKPKEELATCNRGKAHEHEQLIYFRQRTHARQRALRNAQPGAQAPDRQ